MRWWRVGLVGAVLVASGTLVTGPAHAATANVEIKNNAFTPGSVTIKVGDSVRWTNEDPAQIGHTVTSDTGAFDFALGPDESKTSDPFATAGAFQYHCKIHNFMTGAVIVQAPITTTTRPIVTTTVRPATTTTRAVVTTTSSTSTTVLEETTTTEESTTTSSTADIEINEDDGGTNGVAVALLVGGIMAVLGGGGYLLYRLRTDRF